MVTPEISFNWSCTATMSLLQKKQALIPPSFAISCLFYRSDRLAYEGRSLCSLNDYNISSLKEH